MEIHNAWYMGLLEVYRITLLSNRQRAQAEYMYVLEVYRITLLSNTE